MKITFKKPIKSKEKFNPLQEIVEKMADLNAKIWQRCLMEGCRYGYERIDKKPKNECIYCGQFRDPNIDNHFFNFKGPGAI